MSEKSRLGSILVGSPSARLELNSLVLPVLLGVGEIERSVPQKVTINLELRFAPLASISSIARACIDDRYEHTLCYARLSAWVKDVCDQKPYLLIEHLTFQIYTSLIEKISTLNAVELSGLRVQVVKTNLPMPFEVDSASFEVCSWLAN
jgi:dihydroneopterin aldolase